MAIDWDRFVVGPTVSVFGVGGAASPVPIAYQSAATGEECSINGVFDEAYREVDALSGVPVDSVSPMLGVQLSTFPYFITPAQGDRLVIGANTYMVRSVHPDSHGWARLLLNLLQIEPS